MITRMFRLFLLTVFLVVSIGIPSVNAAEDDITYDSCVDKAFSNMIDTGKECAIIYEDDIKAYKKHQKCLDIRPEGWCDLYFVEPEIMDGFNECRDNAKDVYLEEKTACDIYLEPEPIACEWDADLEAEITHLPGFYDGQAALNEPLAVRNDGTVVGRSKVTSKYYRPYMWTQESGMQELVTFGNGKYGVVNDISDNGSFVGKSSSKDSTSEYYAALWKNLDFGPMPLGALPGPDGKQSEVLGINEEGFMAGFATIPGKNFRHVVWDNEGNITELPTFPTNITEFPNGRALDINDNNVIAGWSKDQPGHWIPAIWTFANGFWEIMEVGTLGGLNGEARAINNNDVVVGYSDLGADKEFGFAWTVEGGHVKLDSLPNDPNSYAWDIADNNWIVGHSGITDKTTGATAALWPGIEDCDPIDLHDVLPPFSGWTLQKVTAISPDGRYLVGVGKLFGFEGDVHGWLIDLYPETE